MKLECPQCGHSTILLPAEEKAIREELLNALPGVAKTLECPCGRMQFILESRQLVGWGQACRV